MINLSITGGTKTQRDLTESAVRFFISEILPRKRKLYLDIVIRNTLTEGAAGYCTHLEKDIYLIELHNRGTLFEYLSYLAHECIHLKQYCNKELVTKDRKEFWKGRDITNVSYSKNPSEKEAWTNQDKLAKQYLHSEEISISNSKNLSPRTMKEINWTAEARALFKTADMMEDYDE